MIIMQNANNASYVTISITPFRVVWLTACRVITVPCVYHTERYCLCQFDSVLLRAQCGAFFYFCCTSGSPATLVSKDKTPANTDALTTIFQSTAENTAAVPMVATAVCATVLIARIAAALNHKIVFSFIFTTLQIGILTKKLLFPILNTTFSNFTHDR